MPGGGCSWSNSTASRRSPSWSPTSRCTTCRPSDALAEYLVDHGFRRIAKRLASTGVIDVVGTAAPGIDDLVVLGKIKQLERSGDWDLIVVDGPAAGHAITFLTSAAGLRDAVHGGPIGNQADEVLALLGDPDRCQVVLVTLPETTPVNELIETAYAIEERVGVRLGPVVVNQVDDDGGLTDDGVDGRSRTGRRATRIDAEIRAALDAAAFQLERSARPGRRRSSGSHASLALPQVHLPRRPASGLTSDDIAALATELP